jgi:hypothetical protein
MSFNDESKKQKLSIHNKYNRRLVRLSFSVEEFLKLADMKLDISLFGKVHNREQIMQVVDKCRELAALLQDSKDIIDRPPIHEIFSEVFQKTPEAPKRIFSENDVFRGLTKIRVGGSGANTD